MTRRHALPEALQSLACSTTEELHDRIFALENALAETTPDRASTAQIDELFSLSALLVHSPASSLSDLVLKLEILCRRLHETSAPDQPGEALTYMLAEAIAQTASGLPGGARDLAGSALACQPQRSGNIPNCSDR